MCWAACVFASPWSSPDFLPLEILFHYCLLVAFFITMVIGFSSIFFFLSASSLAILAWPKLLLWILQSLTYFVLVALYLWPCQYSCLYQLLFPSCQSLLQNSDKRVLASFASLQGLSVWPWLAWTSEIFLTGTEGARHHAQQPFFPFKSCDMWLCAYVCSCVCVCRPVDVSPRLSSCWTGCLLTPMPS